MSNVTKFSSIKQRIDPNSIAKNSPEKGQILMHDGTDVVWCDPLNPDIELREKYPELEVSWKRVLEAISEYELVKKLVDDYD